MEPSTRTLAPITSTNEAKASMSTASSTASRTSDSPSKSPLWRLPPDVLTNLQPSYWTRRSSHGPPDGGPAGAVPPAGFVLGFAGAGRRRPNKPSPKRALPRSTREAGSGTPFGKSSPLDIGALAEAVVVANRSKVVQSAAPVQPSGLSVPSR